MMHEHDPLLEQLSALPPLDTDVASAERLRRLARGELSRTTARSELGRRWSALWSSVLEPAMVAAVIVIYAGWGWSTTASLFHEGAPESVVERLSPRETCRTKYEPQGSFGERATEHSNERARCLKSGTLRARDA